MSCIVNNLRNTNKNNHLQTLTLFLKFTFEKVEQMFSYNVGGKLK